MTRHSSAALTIAHATRWVKETFIPRSLSTPLSALRFASSVSTASVRNEVAVGIERLSFIALASIPAGPRRGLASPAARRRRRCAGSVAAVGGEHVGLRYPPARPGAGDLAEVDALGRGDAAGHGGRPVAVAVPVRGRGGRCRSRLAVAARRCRGLRRRGARGRDLGQRLADLHGLVGLLEDLHDRPARGRGDLGVDLVGRDLDHGLALLDGVALLLVPLEHGALGHRLAHLGHRQRDRLAVRRGLGDGGLAAARGRRLLLAGLGGVGLDRVLADVGVALAAALDEITAVRVVRSPESSESAAADAPLPEAGASPDGSSSARTEPTSTVSSTCLRILVRVPLAGAGTSASTLSVETSTTVSPSSTWSPSDLCHSRTVPSVTDSPIWGIWISTVAVAIPSASTLRNGAHLKRPAQTTWESCNVLRPRNEAQRSGDAGALMKRSARISGLAAAFLLGLLGAVPERRAAPSPSARPLTRAPAGAARTASCPFRRPRPATSTSCRAPAC